MCLQDFPFVIVLAFCNSHSCHRHPQIQRGWLFQDVQLPRSSGLAEPKKWPVSVVGPAMIKRAEDRRSLHPWKLRWNQKITQLKRKIIFQTFICGFHVNFPGCMLPFGIIQKCIRVSLKSWLKTIWNSSPKMALMIQTWRHPYPTMPFDAIRFFWSSGNEHIAVAGTWIGWGFYFFDFHPYLGKWSNLTNIFQMGWNHQLDEAWSIRINCFKISSRRAMYSELVGMERGELFRAGLSKIPNHNREWFGATY